MASSSTNTVFENAGPGANATTPKTSPRVSVSANSLDLAKALSYGFMGWHYSTTGIMHRTALAIIDKRYHAFKKMLELKKNTIIDIGVTWDSKMYQYSGMVDPFFENFIKALYTKIIYNQGETLQSRAETMVLCRASKIIVHGPLKTSASTLCAMENHVTLTDAHCLAFEASCRRIEEESIRMQCGTDSPYSNPIIQNIFYDSVKKTATSEFHSLCSSKTFEFFVNNVIKKSLVYGYLSRKNGRLFSATTIPQSKISSLFSETSTKTEKTKIENYIKSVCTTLAHLIQAEANILTAYSDAGTRFRDKQGRLEAIRNASECAISLLSHPLLVV